MDSSIQFAKSNVDQSTSRQKPQKVRTPNTSRKGRSGRKSIKSNTSARGERTQRKKKRSITEKKPPRVKSLNDRSNKKGLQSKVDTSPNKSPTVKQPCDKPKPIQIKSIKHEVVARPLLSAAPIQQMEYTGMESDRSVKNKKMEPVEKFPNVDQPVAYVVTTNIVGRAATITEEAKKVEIDKDLHNEVEGVLAEESPQSKVFVSHILGDIITINGEKHAISKIWNEGEFVRFTAKGIARNCTPKKKEAICKRVKMLGIIMVFGASMKSTNPSADKKEGPIPRMTLRGENFDYGYHYVGIDKLGPSLMDIIAKIRSKGTISNRTAIVIAKKTFQCLRELHHIGYVHRDVKPDVFYFRDNEDNLYIGDFGLGYHFRANVRGKEVPDRGKVPFFGSLCYASRKAHEEKDRRRFQDIESWFYMIVEIFSRQPLPWKNERDKKKVYKLKKWFMTKEGFQEHSTKHALPSRLAKFIEWLGSAHCTSVPPYDEMLSLLAEIQRELKVEDDADLPLLELFSGSRKSAEGN
ncbi:Protein kinase domain-containing protein [Aphelenchoides besseyi]|nr:Protein kinase domain-containing protein [Aphelenchoides besseyi]